MEGNKYAKYTTAQLDLAYKSTGPSTQKDELGREIYRRVKQSQTEQE